MWCCGCCELTVTPKFNCHLSIHNMLTCQIQTSSTYLPTYLPIKHQHQHGQGRAVKYSYVSNTYMDRFGTTNLVTPTPSPPGTTTTQHATTVNSQQPQHHKTLLYYKTCTQTGSPSPRDNPVKPNHRRVQEWYRCWFVCRILWVGLKKIIIFIF